MKKPRNEFYFFWSGPFSQWAMYPIEINGKTYNCNEQYMMSEKARIMGDFEMREKIMAADDPAIQKSLGRQVKNFDAEKWNAECREVVYRANYAKFTQHIFLQNKLWATKNKIIVEASPEDNIWGIGLRESDPRACDPEQWKGTNWLGEAIMRVRKELREQRVF